MTLTTQEFLNKLQRVKLKISTDDTPLKLASYSAIALQSKRIFTDGLKSDGSPIGQYSTKDIWVSPKVSRNKSGFRPLKGKEGNTEFITNPERVRRTSYFEGWKGLREAQGLPVDNIKLDFQGDLRSDFENPQGGFPTTRKVSNTEYVTSLKRQLSRDKLDGNEDRFGVIRKLTKQEKDSFYDVIRFQLRKLIAEA